MFKKNQSLNSAGRRRTLRSLFQRSEGFAAAESVLMALLLCGLAMLVAKALLPGARIAAKSLNRELAGMKSKRGG